MCGNSSVVEHRLAMARVASSNLVFRLKDMMIHVFFFALLAKIAQIKEKLYPKNAKKSGFLVLTIKKLLLL